MQHEDGAKARAGWVAALAPALKVKPGAFGFMADGGVDASLHQEWMSALMLQIFVELCLT